MSLNYSTNLFIPQRFANRRAAMPASLTDEQSLDFCDKLITIPESCVFSW